MRIRVHALDRRGETLTVGCRIGYAAPELIPPVLVVTTEIEASKQQAAWSAVDSHILPHHTVSSSVRFTVSDGRTQIGSRSSESALVR